MRASELEASPSAALGMSATEEWRERRGACALLAMLCRDLIGTKREAERVRAIVCTSQLYFQRFFCLQALQEHSSHVVACACLMLAAKAEEAPLRAVSIVEGLADRWPRAVVAAATSTQPGAAAAASDDAAPTRTTALEALRRAVLEKEHCLLFTLSFDVAVHLPFNWVSRAIHSLSKAHPRWPDSVGGRAGMERLARAADMLLFDSFSTPACLTLTPKEAAVAALAVAARVALATDLPASFVSQHSSSARCASFAMVVLGAALDASNMALPPPGRKPSTPSASQPATATSASGGASAVTPGPAGPASASASGAASPDGRPNDDDDLPPPIPAPAARRQRMSSGFTP